MKSHSLDPLLFVLLGLFAGLLAGCAVPTARPDTPALTLQTGDMAGVLNRVTWGATPALVKQVEETGLARYIEQQLHPAAAPLPAAVQDQIHAMTISRRTLEELHQDLERMRKDADAKASDDEKKTARRAYQQELTRLAREAATRSLLRALYSPEQLQEQLTWFWMNHFNVYQGKHNLRAMVGDYEERAIRPHALGKFRDLLAATAQHPAMLRYLDNDQNALHRQNENYARELLELHTLGVNGGYSQHDVQELARVLTGVGVNLGAGTPRLRPELQSRYVRRGLFEFNPARHDEGEKQLLGQTVRASGLAELSEVLDRLSRQSATAHFISSKLAVFFVSDEPSPALVERMAQTFLQSDGDIAATLRSLFTSTEFAQSLGGKFKDPVHYLVSAVRLAYDDKPITNVTPMLNWLALLGEPLYGHQTPDGYSMLQAAWASPAQMVTRFEVAKALASGNAGLFKADGLPDQRPASLRQANPAYFSAWQENASDATRDALKQAGSLPEWAEFVLSSPEMMHR
ncbi:MAG: DUF1800 domain-containing protein [Comamonadaceae bacterium]